MSNVDTSRCDLQLGAADQIHLRLHSAGFQQFCSKPSSDLGNESYHVLTDLINCHGVRPGFLLLLLNLLRVVIVTLTKLLCIDTFTLGFCENWHILVVM